MSQEPDSLIETVREERAKYGTPLENWMMGVILNDVAVQHDDWFLALKESGAHTLQPQTGTHVSRDVLIHGTSKRMYDVLRDVEGEAQPNWLYVGQADMELVTPVGTDEPVDPGDDGAVRYQLEAALRYLAEAKDAVADTEAAIQKALDKL